MKHNFLLVFLVAFTLQCCKLGSSETLRNAHIDKNTKEQIKILTDRLFSAITTDDASTTSTILSQRLREDNIEFRKTFALAHASFSAQSYRMLDEYHIKVPSTNNDLSLTSGKSGDDDYSIDYAFQQETYVALFLPNGLNNDFLITAIYTKNDDQWLLEALEFGQYGLFGKTAPEYYNAATVFYAKGYLVDALSNMELANLCLQPANNLWKYNKETEILEFSDKLKNEMNTKYPFPYSLDNVEGKPQIFRIHAGLLDDGFYPIVYYLTGISLEDTPALEIEYKNVKTEVNRIFTGINKDKKYIFYRAYNEIPDGERQVEHVGFVDEGVKSENN